MCAPDSIDRPIASTSSSTAAAATVVGCLEQPGVDHLVAGVAQDAGDDFDAAVVAVEADLGDQDPLAAIRPHQIVGTSTWRPNTSPSVAMISPSVA